MTTETMTSATPLEWAEEALQDESNSTSSNLLLGYLVGRTAQTPLPINPTMSPDPADLYDAFAESYPTARNPQLQNFFELVARPGAVLDAPLQSGDLVLRRGLAEGNLTHLFVLVDGQLHSLEQARASGLITEAQWPGYYVIVAEPGAFRHRSADKFARRLISPDRRLAPNQLILRLKLTPVLTEATEATEISEELPASNLRWSGASAEQLEFMRQVYNQQVSRASRQRSFIADVPASELGEIENGKSARSAAARSCQQLLAQARQEKGRRVESISVVSAYRSASQQFTNWQRAFPRYFRETANARSNLVGGEYSEAAVIYLANYIGQRLAAPGFSLHNNGLAIDFGTRENGVSLGASTSAASIQGWRQSWLFGWLSNNAATYNFYQNTAINEPWHWEYRAATTTNENVAESTTTIEDTANLSVETVAIAAGREEISSVPLLSGHRGSPPDLILRWNDMSERPQVVDVVVHFHGYSQRRDHMNLSRDKEPSSGLDFSDPGGSGTQGRTRPTLALLPRGNYFGGKSGTGYNFPALRTGTGLQNLIDYGLEYFARAQGISGLRRGRLILTAHSGGGADLLNVLAQINPDEVHIFDALYQNARNLANWAAAHLRLDQAALASLDQTAARRYMQEQGGAMRVLYIAHTGTASFSQAVGQAIAQVLPTDPVSGINLSQWYRVQSTSVVHGNIPRRYGWHLLADASANLPATS